MKSPFKFLDSYKKEDRDIFFGRDKETDQLYEKVFESNLILLHGLSGTGKSSLINCGLSNKFADTDWFSLFIRRENNIIESIKKHLQASSLQALPDDMPIPKMLRSVFYDQYRPIYLIFDQFEELFIISRDEKERKAFFELLASLLALDLPLTILLSMREEYIAYLSDYEYLIPSLFEGRFRLEKMRRHHIREVIKGTLQAYDIPIEDPETTIEAIINNIADYQGTVDLTNLQVYLDLMYKKRASETNEKITFDPELVDQIGDLGSAMQIFLRQSIYTIGEEINNQEVPLAILYSMVTFEGTRKPVALSEIPDLISRDHPVDLKTIKYCLKRFEEMRILRGLVELNN